MSENEESGMEIGEDEPLQFSDLNDDCVERIFNFLDVLSKLNFLKVCTRWSGLTWKITKLHLYGDNLHFRKNANNPIRWEDLCSILQKSGSHVEELSLSNDIAFDTLRIDDEQYQVSGIYPEEPDERINYISQMCHNLRKLNLIMYDDDYEEERLQTECQKLMDKNREIKSLYLACFYFENFSSLARKILRFVEFITELNLDHMMVNADDLCRILCRAKNLTALKMGDWCLITEPVLQCIGRYCTGLTHLDFYCKDERRTTLEGLKNLSHLQCLKVLSIHSKQKARPISDLLIAISDGCLNLTQLHLTRFYFSSDGINPLLQKPNFSKLVLSACKFICHESPSSHQANLQHLEMERVQINEIELNTFFVFRELKTLKCICLKNLSDRNLQTIAASSTQLKRVELKGNGEVTGKGIQHLRDSLPSVSLYVGEN